MAVKRKTIRFTPFAGQDQRWKGELGGASQIINMRVDDAGLGWVADRGLDPWWDPKASVVVNGPISTQIDFLVNKVDSCYVWNKQGENQSYYIVEQAGRLYYWLGNKGSGGYQNDYIEIASDRHIPKTRDTGTQYIPYGDRLLIINGYDEPIWFYGRGRARSFGFLEQTPQPEVIGIQTDYLNGQTLKDGIASPVFSSNETLGLGVAEKKRNHFIYSLTYITDTGSESPLSSDIVIDWIPGGNNNKEKKKFGVCLSTVPIAPEGAVARRIYRTKNVKNIADGGADGVKYYVKQINENTSTFFIDITPDSDLVDRAPMLTDSTTISANYGIGETWNGRIWLGGGKSHPTRIIYSEKGLPEQFGLSNYFELGNTTGGHITGLKSYYNNLLVFRESSIDVIRMLSDGSFSHGQITPVIGTRATNTIQLVPGAGVFFLAMDGIYVVSGGLDGGSSIDVKKISGLCDKDIKTLNRSAIDRAIAGYSKKEREYWCHFPSDTDIIPNRGLVYHSDIGQWSSRRAPTDADNDLYLFSSMTVDKDGSFIFGTSPTWRDPMGNPGTPGILGHTGNLVGQLYVWCGEQYMGKSWATTMSDNDWSSYSVTDLALPKSVYESNWIELEGNDTKHRILSVELEILSYGDNKLKLSYATDHSHDLAVASIQKQNKPETLYTVKEDPVFGVVDNKVSKNFFTLGEDKLQDGRITRLRYDVNTKLINNFKFRVETDGPQSPFHLISFHINYSTSHQQTRNAGI